MYAGRSEARREHGGETRPPAASATNAAILIDATLVRAVLLPATMKLLGERNWYLPRWLEWLPRLDREEPSTAPKAKPVLSA